MKCLPLPLQGLAFAYILFTLACGSGSTGPGSGTDDGGSLEGGSSGGGSSGSSSSGGASAPAACGLDSNGRSCICSNGAITTPSASCGPSDVDQGYGSLCCSYAAGPTCICGAFVCVQFGSGDCVCNWAGQPGPPMGSCTGTYCCATQGQSAPGVCSCGSTPCTGGYTQVAQCDSTTTPQCSLDEQRVTACR